MTRPELVQATMLALTKQNVTRGHGGGGSFTARGSLSTLDVIKLGPVPRIPDGLAATMTVDASIIPMGDIIETNIGQIPSGLSEQFEATAVWEDNYLIDVDISSSEQMTETIGVDTDLEVINDG